jgi:hypothetical protein
MWIQCCIILHNLVLQIEAGKDDREWREELYNLWDQRKGAEHRCWQEEAETESEDDLDELKICLLSSHDCWPEISMWAHEKVIR